MMTYSTRYTLFPYTTLFRSEHLVVQDLFLTETAVYADVVLPASAWPEKDGTVTNTNRQVQKGRQALPLPGDRKSTRLNSSHVKSSYAVYCLKKKKKLRIGKD